MSPINGTLALETMGMASTGASVCACFYSCFSRLDFIPVPAMRKTQVANGNAISTQYSFELGLFSGDRLADWALADTEQEEGIAKLIDGLSATRATRARIHDLPSLALLAEIYLRRNKIDEGLTAIEEAQKLAVTEGALFWQAELFRLKGELLLGQSGNPFVKQKNVCAAVKIAQNQHATMASFEPPRAWPGFGKNSIKWRMPNAS
ncbi:MAG: hypothetical protein HS120_04110 [Burkholderiales bacterium]|nr:hypothetical protein [Burkholderiales bacterium]